MSHSESPFLAVAAGDWLCSNDLAFAIFDGFPVSPGHILVTTRRIVETWFDATDEEQSALMALVKESKRLLDLQLSPKPDGYNVGFNSGGAAGQTVPHVHIHVIPRFLGDMPDPRGGVRHVIPEKGNYLTGTSSASRCQQAPRARLKTGRDRSPQRSGECVEKDHSPELLHYPPMVSASLPILTDRPEVDPCQSDLPRRTLTLSTGQPHSPLWKSIGQRVSSAVEVDLLASFIQPSGLDLIQIVCKSIHALDRIHHFRYSRKAFSNHSA